MPKHIYDWVSVKEDLPFEDPERPGMSEVVLCKFDYKKCPYQFGYYDFKDKCWRGAGYNNPFKNEVLAWTIVK